MIIVNILIIYYLLMISILTLNALVFILIITPIILANYYYLNCLYLNFNYLSLVYYYPNCYLSLIICFLIIVLQSLIKSINYVSDTNRLVKLLFNPHSCYTDMKINLIYTYNTFIYISIYIYIYIYKYLYRYSNHKKNS